MIKTKTLSIIVPAYNCASYVHNLFEHIPFSQLDNEVEIIVIDDGSKDDTYNVLLKIANTYGKENVRVYKKENGNWGSVHNFAKHLEINGRFVKTLDSDDYLDPYGLIKFISYLKTMPDDLDIVFSNVNFINNKDEIISQKFYNHLFKKQFFSIDEIKITKLSVLTVHTFTINTKIYQNLNDLPEKMSYMDSVFIFLVMNAARNKSSFFSYAPLYQYQSGNESQSISIQNFSKHADWIKIMLDTQATYFMQLKMDKTNSVAKNKILGQMMQLGFFHYCYAIVHKEDLTNKKKSELMFEELKNIKDILNINYNKYFADAAIKIIYFFQCKILPGFLHLATLVLNSGYLKATKKDGKRQKLKWSIKKSIK